MSTRLSTEAGVLSFDGPSDPAWVANGSGLSGDWSDSTHWSPDTVPGIGDDATISDDDTATAGWLVTETNESAASLTLDMNLGTLLVDPETVVTVAAFTQTAGTAILTDDGTVTTTLDSSGTDSVNGQVTLVSGATWLDAALGIGLGLVDSGTAVSSAVTLEGGSAGGELSVAGALEVGGDPDSNSAGGVGSLELDNGSVAYAGGLSVLNGSAISVDGSSGIAVGDAATTAVSGAITIGTDGAVQADIATLGADVLNSGSLAIVGWLGNDTTAAGNVQITGSLLNDGAVTVAPGATLAVGGSIELDAGSLSVGVAATLNAGDAGGSDGVYLAGGQMTLDGAVLDSLGSADFANSDATLLDGATWYSNTLSIAPGYSDGTTADATVSLDGGSALIDSSSLNIGNDPGIGSSVATDPGGIGTLALTGASEVTTTALAVQNGSVLTLDSSSSVVVGTATAEAGTVAIGPDGLLVADIATIGASVDDAGTLDVTTLADGSLGSALVTGSLTGGGTVTVDGTLEVGNGSSFAGMISIAGGGELILDAGDMAGAVVAANGQTATIDVAGQDFDSAGFTPTYDTATGLLVFGDAASQSTLDVGAGLPLSDLLLSSDNSGTGTLITEAPCYVAGTLIQAARGDVPVEALRPGDKVRTVSGRLAPVVWVGRRQIELRRHPQPWRMAPVRILASALAPGVPARDLWVSPDHALFVGGALVPASRLANGATIARQDGLASVTYLHIELDRHDIILAENCPAESYLDTGNRGLFANAAGPHPLHPDLSGAPDPAALAVWAAQGASPLVLEGDALAALRAQVEARAVALGWAPTSVSRPSVLAEGTPLVVRPAGEGAWRVRLHQDTERLQICSDSFVPAEVFAGSGDMRRLGLAVRALLLDDAPLPPTAFGTGWHAAEDGWRWSNGHGEIMVPRRRRRSVLEVLTAPEGHYWRPPRRRAAANPPGAATR